MKGTLITAILLGFICSMAPAQAELKVHCSGEGPLVYLVGGGPAFTTWNLEPIQQLKGSE
jgi:hypothetical protein